MRGDGGDLAEQHPALRVALSAEHTISMFKAQGATNCYDHV